MSNTSEIICKIINYLDKFMLKKSKLTDSDLISYVEDKWRQADDEKFTIHNGSIIMDRMITEYIGVKDFDNMMRWIKMSRRHESSQEEPNYILNYYDGQCCLECGNEEKAFEYFNLCYKENPEYIYTRAPFCYEFFNKQLKSPRILESVSEEYVEECYIELTHWQKFFKEDKEFCISFSDKDRQEIYKITTKQEKTMEHIKENQELMLHNVLTKLLKQYSSLQKKYCYSEEEKPDFMPDVDTIDGFSDLLSLSCIYVLENDEKEPYIGFLFSCSWDSEHGLGIMTYEGNVEKIGGADTAFG